MLENVKKILWAADKLHAIMDVCESKHLALGRTEVKAIEPMLAWHR